jgi:hypothetical protein
MEEAAEIHIDHAMEVLHGVLGKRLADEDPGDAPVTMATFCSLLMMIFSVVSRGIKVSRRVA